MQMESLGNLEELQSKRETKQHPLCCLFLCVAAPFASNEGAGLVHCTLVRWCVCLCGCVRVWVCVTTRGGVVDLCLNPRDFFS